VSEGVEVFEVELSELPEDSFDHNVSPLTEGRKILLVKFLLLRSLGRFFLKIAYLLGFFIYGSQVLII